jgi:hypothetical protein
MPQLAMQVGWETAEWSAIQRERQRGASREVKTCLSSFFIGMQAGRSAIQLVTPSSRLLVGQSLLKTPLGATTTITS